MDRHPVIKPVGKWARELGITCRTLKKWLAEECGLVFDTDRLHRISLVEECYIKRVLDKHLAKPLPLRRVS
jgi:predicted transcriptional regulator